MSSPLQPSLKARNVVRAEPGDRIEVEVTLARPDDAPDTVASLYLRVPAGARGYEYVRLGGGRGRLDISGGGIDSFKGLLRALNGGEHLNDLIARGLGRPVTEPVDVDVNGRGSFTVRVVR